jgi:hypothetical protein
VHVTTRNPNIPSREVDTENKRRTPKKEYMPPLQEVPLQEAPLSPTGQVHVEQEIQGLPLQIDLQQAQSGVHTPQILCRFKQVCKQV